ncbi:protoporphyrinogen oxidase [Actinoplanes sp. NPDC051411]|uniref:protoporphyrinogen oxidase n=1 Tax=Actinoplanes sp. NPDC051411 TaxID=3155522 RepID=UPI003415C750
MRKRVAIIGGGVAGLAAAVRLRDLTPPSTELIVYEQSGALGGKLRTGRLGGVTAERGAESFLMSAPDGSESAALALVRRLDLEDELRHPAAIPAALAIGGDLARIPGGTLIGVPGNLAQVSSVAEPATDRDRDEGRPLLAAGEDVAVGELVRGRYGDQVVDRLVDPLLGGVYAGRADQLSLAVTIPQLARTARVEHTLQAAVQTAQAEAAARRAPGRPVFGALDGGMSRLVAAAAAASGARISLGLPVREVGRTRDGWRLVLGAAPAPQIDEVDAVVLAVPSRAAAKLLTGVAPEAAEAVGVLDYASVALVGMAFPAGTELPELSGFLVPPSEDTLVKAATFVTRKWSHLAGPGDRVLVRASLGRAGEAGRLQFDDAVLLERAHRELSELTGRPLPAPEETFLQRWGGGLPQYTPGHLDRVARVRGALPAGLAMAGASLDGVGIPACVASGERAAEDVHKVLEEAA